MKQLFLAILVFTCVFAEAQITVEINGPTTANVNETKNYTLTWRDGFYQISPPWDGTPNWFTFGGSVTSGNESGASVQWTSAGIHSLYFEYSTWNNFYSDNLTVTINSEAPNTPGTIFTTTQNCNSTTVQRNSNPPSGVEWYWQTSSSGTTTLLGSSNSITRTAGGNLYLRARNSSGTWSTSSQSVGNLSIVTPPAAPANATHGDIISNTGGQVPLSVSSVSGATAYRWYTVASGGTPISGATTTTYSPTVTTTTTYYAEAVTGNCASTSRTAVTANVHPTPQIIGNTTITMGEPVTLSLNYTYDSVQWRRNGADIAGATQPTYTATEPGTYSVQVEKGSATPASSSTKTVTTGPYGQNRNFIVSNTILTAGITDAAAVDNLPVEHNAQTIQYFDGLGRPIQTVTTQGSPDKKDIVQPIVYDAFGREAVKYLPYVADDVTGWYKTDPVGMVNNYVGSPHHQFYTNANTTIARDAQPYAVTIFEPSPLNRVIKQGAPGTTWQPNSEHSYNATDHTIKFDYAFNEANEVLLWSYTYPTTPNSFGLIAAGTTTAPVYYEANQLYKNKTKDEQGHEVIEYKDKQGRVVLKRVQAVDTPGALTGTNKDIHYASTYYIYDDFNNLVCVIQPEGTKNINQYLDGDDTVKENFLNRWAFRYHYDGRRRMIIKQVPGAGKVYMVYDKRDRLVMTQDANQRATHQWLFTKYDALNRPVLTGIQTVATGIAQDSMQTLVNTYYANLSTNNGAWYETFDPAIPGNVHGYSNRSFPLEAAANNYLTVMYYDRYDFKTLLAGSERYDYKNDELTTQPATAFNRVTGQVTGTKTKVLNGGTTGFTWLHTVNYYDDRYRVIQTVTDNYKNGYDRITNHYDFVGKVLETRTTHFTNDLHWTDLVGATWYNERLTRTAPNAGWGTSGAASAEMLPANTDGWFEFVPIGINRAYMIGFSPTNADAGYASIKYAYFINNNGTLQIRENGSSTNLLGTVRNYVAGDVFRVERKNGKINYYHNSTLLLQRDAINDALLIDASLNGSSMSITGFRASFGTPETHSTTRRFVYDHAGRLLKTYHQMDAHDEILLSENQYNELGELITKKLHSTDDTHFKQHADYRYNIRGWLTRMNNAALTPDDSNEPRDLFGFELGYEQLLSGLSTTGQLQYNGNISAMKWSSNLGLGNTQQDQVTQRGYAFDYDPLNRLKAASHKEHTGTWNATTAFHENNLTYDLNGNIKTLNRTGKDGSAMDVLSYNYGNTTTVSNRLLRVTDTGDKTAGFKDGYPSDVDYAYDSNGNLIWDRNKGGIDVAKNGDFANGTTDWTITDTESRLSVANNELTITAGTTTAELSQQDLVEGSKYYIAIIDLERTAGSVTVSLGGSTPVTLSTTSVHHRPIRSSNANKDLVITFSADFAGKIKRVELKGVTVITYNHLNLPDVVTRAGDKQLKYIYDATGRKLAQVLGTATTHEKRTEYNGEYIYENDTLKLINHEEGRIIPDSLGQAYYEYHLKDHLGNVRLTFTTKHEVEETTATLETAQAEEESGQFLYYDEAVKVNAPLFDHTNKSCFTLSGGANLKSQVIDNQ